MKDIQIITTSDGSHSLLNTRLNETYHSHHGAVQESLHVFISRGLNYLLARNPSLVTVFEVGFGTGLNALLTMQAVAGKNVQLNYTSIEAFPLAREIWSHLNYAPSGNDAALFASLHEAPWNERVAILKNFQLLKRSVLLQDPDFEMPQCDLVYFDAFAPSKQPEMWTPDVLKKVCNGLNPGGVFVTYCAKGQLKRDLKDIGLEVETLAGPPGKKEMVRALKN